jgi:hypothetical protein
MAQELAVADWLEELAVFGRPRCVPTPETAHHLSRAIFHWYIVKLALDPMRNANPVKKGGRGDSQS